MFESKRNLFSLPEGEHYLNAAYMGPLAKPVEEAAIRALLTRRDPTQIRPEHFFADSQRVRELFARLVHAPDPSRVALVPSASYGIATVAKNLDLRGGQNVVVAHAQFPSNVYTWRRMCADLGAELRAVEPPAGSENRSEGWNARLLEAIDAGTAIVALGNVHWADGTRFDLERIGARAREVGAALVIDGTQSVGAMPFDVTRVRPDALVCASYKHLMGPYALGCLWLGPRFDDGRPLEETWLGRRGSEDFSRLVDYVDDYQPGALRYDMGERSAFVLTQMLIAALEMIQSWGPEHVQAYCRGLMAEAVDEARALGYVVEDEAWRGWHMFGLRLPASVDPARLQALLRERRVTVSVRGDAVRVAPNVYNESDDVDALMDALRAAVG
ncbi:aminotransferase class V-fold PLP-dependent enzyme [Longimicrobium sp.]|uniref:aminotransferase class V-fold PLP-dependent enzyme n=1 Tax=Longimicrobium sp. TaxID=2029185 RepID=UPI002E32BA4A|nr:aminotransferase class V-fold PLP-dependent enzyme [Longimicrobium sp.]HEX6040777.1 aminotransferase class V-fold PLP-dependent enzyme [Longimicrobium sp.]